VCILFDFTLLGPVFQTFKILHTAKLHFYTSPSEHAVMYGEVSSSLNRLLE
jgi:hypothetical protein